MSVATLPEGDWIRGISIKQPYAACSLGVAGPGVRSKELFAYQWLGSERY